MSRVDEYEPDLSELCAKHGVPVDMVIEMLCAEFARVGMKRRHNLYNDLCDILERYLQEDMQT